MLASTGSTRCLAAAMQVISGTVRMRMRDAANAAKWNGAVTTSPDALPTDVPLLAVLFGTRDPSVGTARLIVYRLDTSAVVTDSGMQTGLNTGAASVNRVWWGPRASQNASNFIMEEGDVAYDLSASNVFAPRSNDTVDAGPDQTDIEPWTTVTLTASSSSGTVAWSQLSGDSVTLSGTGLSRTFTAPPNFAGSTLTFRATNGSATDDVSVSVLPVTDGVVTGVGPLVVTPIRITRVT